MGKKKSGKKKGPKGKKGKGKKSKKSKKAEEVLPPPPTRFPWDPDCTGWMSPSQDHRAKLRKQFRLMATARSYPPLYDEHQWRERLFDFMGETCSPECEEMVKLLVTVTRFEGDRKFEADDPRRMAAAIRARNKETNLKRMREDFCMYFKQLDTNPNPDDVLSLLKGDLFHGSTFSRSSFIPRSVLENKLKLMDLTFGDSVTHEQEQIFRQSTKRISQTSVGSSGAAEAGQDDLPIDTASQVSPVLEESSDDALTSSDVIDDVGGGADSGQAIPMGDDGVGEPQTDEDDSFNVDSAGGDVKLVSDASSNRVIRSPKPRRKKHGREISLQQAIKIARRASFSGTIEPEHIKRISSRCRRDSEVRSLARSYHEANVKKFIELETDILRVVQDDMEMDRLWKVLDLTATGRIGLNDLEIFVAGKFPLLNARVPAAMAYMDALKTEDEADVSTSPGSPSKGGKMITRKRFRAFLLKLYYYNRFWCSFLRVDSGGNMKIEKAEWQAGAASLGRELGFELDGSEEEFNKISRDAFSIKFKDVATWYSNQIDDMEALSEDWEAETQYVPDILQFQMSEFTDLVLHCYYTNRE